jgi:hypothetical protein
MIKYSYLNKRSTVALYTDTKVCQAVKIFDLGIYRSNEWRN